MSCYLLVRSCLSGLVCMGADMRGKILEGVKIIISCVHKVMAHQRRSPNRLLLEDAAGAQDTADPTSEEGA